MTRRSRNKKKRTVRIVIEAPDATDPRAIIEAVESAFHAATGQAPKREPDDSDAKSVEEPRLVADEPLETEVRQKVGKHLDARNKQIEAKQRSTEKAGDDAEDSARRTPDPPEQIVEKRKRISDWVKRAGAAGYKLTIKVVADLIKELSDPN